MNWVTSYRPGPGRRGKINLNFYFHAFLWCIKRIYEGRKSNTPLWMFFTFIYIVQTVPNRAKHHHLKSVLITFKV